MARRAKKILVYGTVQGVGFRYFVQRAARNLGLAGSVRNLPDSTVEILVEGEEGLIDQFLEEVRSGPPMASVNRLEITDVPPGGTYKSFHIEGW